MRRTVQIAGTVGLAGLLATSAAAPSSTEVPELRLFFEAADADDKRARQALDRIAAAWRDGYAPLIVDLTRFMRSPGRQSPVSGSDDLVPSAPDDEPRGSVVAGRGVDALAAPSRASNPTTRVRQRLTRFLEKQTGRCFGDDLAKWRAWMWSRPYEPHPDYAFFKAALYSSVDRRMATFFAGPALIRLDEVDWGGVRVNGIPPLDHPRHVPAREAGYLKDKHVVFGLTHNGEARAYPKRILGWHELARDRVGGLELAIVYCTLCGTVIPYGAEVGGRLRTFGTSGLLYRSNKLMFDEETSSLWSTLEGRPVVGPLAGTGLELQAYPVVTTTWGEWVAEHPETTVLSLDTGHERDYSEGAAYREYFATDRLMFGVSRTDARLKNKADVLTLLLRPTAGARGSDRRALALDAEFLKRHPLHPLAFAGHDLLVITSREGANRVYDAGGKRFVSLRKDGRIEDADGGLWKVTEAALVRGGSPADERPRVPARRAFWFAWFAQFPDTELVK